jgi:hypothetical protein
MTLEPFINGAHRADTAAAAILISVLFSSSLPLTRHRHRQSYNLNLDVRMQGEAIK